MKSTKSFFRGNIMKNNRLYESIKTGLNEALEDAKTESPVLKRNKVSVEPVKVFKADEVKNKKFNRVISKAFCLLYRRF